MCYCGSSFLLSFQLEEVSPPATLELPSAKDAPVNSPGRMAVGTRWSLKPLAASQGARTSGSQPDTARRPHPFRMGCQPGGEGFHVTPRVGFVSDLASNQRRRRSQSIQALVAACQFGGIANSLGVMTTRLVAATHLRARCVSSSSWWTTMQTGRTTGAWTS